MLATAWVECLSDVTKRSGVISQVERDGMDPNHTDGDEDQTKNELYQ